MKEEEREAHERDQVAAEERLKVALARRDKEADDAVPPLSKSGVAAGFTGGVYALDEAMEESDSTWSMAYPQPRGPGRTDPQSPSSGSGSRST